MEKVSRGRTWVGAAAIVALLLTGCAKKTPKSSFADLKFKRRANTPVLLTLMPDSTSARETYNGLQDELGEEYDLVPALVSAKTKPKVLDSLIQKYSPKAVVLMNNPTLRLYRRFQTTASPAQKAVPVICVLTSFLRQTSKGIKNLTGVVYEVPLVTSLVNLRALIQRPVRRVGVLYRPIFRDFIEEQRKLSASEGIQLIGVEITGKKRSEISENLEKLRRKEGVDAIWIPNDNALLKRDLVVRGWLPALRKNKTPVIVNVRSLLSRRVSFGTFGVLPDHRALGTQAAQMITALADQGWKVERRGEFEYPISVEKVLDMNFARRYLKLKSNQLATIDQLVE